MHLGSGDPVSAVCRRVRSNRVQIAAAEIGRNRPLDDGRPVTKLKDGLAFRRLGTVEVGATTCDDIGMQRGLVGLFWVVAFRIGGGASR